MFHRYLESEDVVVCPIDPNHSVNRSNLKSHVNGKCPKLKQIAEMESSRYFSKDINIFHPETEEEKV